MTDSVNLTATVVHVVDDFHAVINRGGNDGVKLGDVYLLYAQGPEIFDGEESLGNLEVVRGRAKVVHLQPKMATLKSIEFKDVDGRKKIIRRDGIALLTGIQREEIEENPSRVDLPIEAEKGDLAKLIKSGS